MSVLRLSVFAVLLLICLSATCFCLAPEAIYTSSRNVTGVLGTSDGRVIVATRGGVLERSSGGMWRKFTILDGLPENEVLGVYLRNGSVIAYTIKGCARLMDGKWGDAPDEKPAGRLLEGQVASARWNGTDYAAVAEGLRVRSGESWKPVPMPDSKGTHISALLDKKDALWAALYGDGIFAWNGRDWKPVRLALPEHAREITAMAAVGDKLWVGTSRDGVWEYDGKRWNQHLQTDEPWDHSCQAIARYKDNLYVSTLENGLVVRSANGWRRVGTPELSSDTPRQIVEFDGCLYVRQSIGTVDRFDGKVWKKNDMPNLPRKQCSAIFAGKDRLYVGQWGGWSEFDGKNWTNRLDIRELQGCQVTALLSQADRLWVGTQGLGLAEVNRTTGTVKWHNELSGLPDDTIKCIACCGDTICAGTFSQGLAWMKKGDRWTGISELATAQITCLEPDGAGGLYVGARTGLWHLTADKQMKPVIQGVEVQALQLLASDLWVGTRTGLMRFAVGSDFSAK